ncbi:MAG: hypothetical protein GY711_08815, partial [bacterium]|nr:hypothetical protein [bacterium]
MCWPTVHFVGVEAVESAYQWAQYALGVLRLSNVELYHGDLADETNDADVPHVYGLQPRRYTHVYTAAALPLVRVLHLLDMAQGGRVILPRSPAVEAHVRDAFGLDMSEELAQSGGLRFWLFFGDVAESEGQRILRLGVEAGAYDTDSNAEQTEDEDEEEEEGPERRAVRRRRAAIEPLGSWTWAMEEVDIGGALGASMDPHFTRARVFYRVRRDERVPWLLMAQSSVLQRMGAAAQWGLYPLRAFKSNACVIDRYGDTVVASLRGARDTVGDDAEARRVLAQLVREGRRNLMLVERADGTGMSDVIDAGPTDDVPAWAINAALGSGRMPSVRFNRRGRCRAVQTIGAVVEDAGDEVASMLSSLENCTLPSLWRRELLAVYGADYWRGMANQAGDARPATGGRKRGRDGGDGGG